MRRPDWVEEESVWRRWLKAGKGDRDRGGKDDSLDRIGVVRVVLGDRGADNSCLVCVIDGVGPPHTDSCSKVREFVPYLGRCRAHETDGNNARS